MKENDFVSHAQKTEPLVKPTRDTAKPKPGSTVTGVRSAKKGRESGQPARKSGLFLYLQI